MGLRPMSEVVLLPGGVWCPTCGHSLHQVAPHTTPGGAPPVALTLKCLNSRCAELGVLKLLPLERVNVEVLDAPPDDGS